MNRRRIGTKGHQPDSDWPVAPATSWWLESIGLAVLGALTVLLVATSWRRWPDPLIDFGRELYVPWRLAQGRCCIGTPIVCMVRFRPISMRRFSNVLGQG